VREGGVGNQHACALLLKKKTHFQPGVCAGRSRRPLLGQNRAACFVEEGPEVGAVLCQKSVEHLRSSAAIPLVEAAT